MARYDDLNTTAIGYATFVSSILLLVIILLVRALCYSWVGGEDARKTENAHYVEADAMIAAQKERISLRGTVEVEVAPAEGSAPPAADAVPKMEKRLHIPIDEAKELLLNKLVASGSGSEV